MTHRMFLVLATLLLMPRFASAGFLQFDFYSSPFSPPGLEAMCERWHDVHHDWANHYMVGSNSTDPSSCSQGFPCSDNPPPYPPYTCPACSNPPNICSTTNAGAHFLINAARFDPNTTGLDRYGLVTVGIPGPDLQGEEHPTVYSVTHPNCHLGVQAPIWGKRDDIPGMQVGDYLIQIVVTDDFSPGFADCYGVFNNESPLDINNVFPLTLGTTPRYALALHSWLPFHPYCCWGDASLDLYDTWNYWQLVSHVDFPGFYTVPYPYFSGEAKRFGFGGTRLPAGQNVYTFDNFVGVAN